MKRPAISVLAAAQGAYLTLASSFKRSIFQSLIMVVGRIACSISGLIRKEAVLRFTVTHLHSGLCLIPYGIASVRLLVNDDLPFDLVGIGIGSSFEILLVHKAIEAIRALSRHFHTWDHWKITPRSVFQIQHLYACLRL